jgi:Flp pilus assembly protein TadG
MTLQQTTNKKQRGQSLVEVALFLPIFVMLIAGVVEISQLVITQNKVSNAARTASRFGANGGEDEGIILVALNSVTQTLEMDENRWDIWTIHGTTNSAGTGFADWTFDHNYGISQTQLFSDVNEAAIQQKILGELQTNEQGNVSAGIAGDLDFVATYVLHDVDSIIGLDAFPALAEVSSAEALSVMRVTGLNLEPTKGCDAFPIAVHRDIRSVSVPGSGANPFPDPSDFSNHSPEPLPTYQEFTSHVPDIPLDQAKEGYVYKIKNGSDPGNFGWLVWNDVISANANTLEDSLTWPGDSQNYEEGPGGKFTGYQEPGDYDREMNIGDWVKSSTGSINSSGTRGVFDEHIEFERQLRVIVWDDVTKVTGDTLYQISGFAIFRMLGYSLDQSDGSWILAEFIRWDDSCGQEIAASP